MLLIGRSLVSLYIISALVILIVLHLGDPKLTWFVGLYLGIPAIMGSIYLSKHLTLKYVTVIFPIALIISLTSFILINQDTIRQAIALYIEPKLASQYESQRREIETFITSSLPCNTTLNGESLDGISPHRFTIVIAGEIVNSGTILQSIEIKEDIYRTTIESRIPNITVEALIGIPETWNGAAIIFVHGLDVEPNDIFRRSSILRVKKLYTNEIGLRLLDEGYMVVAPFVFSDELWTQNARYFSQYSYHGVDFIEVMIAKMMSIIDYLELQGVEKIGVYGISWGATISRKWASVEDRIDIVVINGNPFDPVARIFSPAGEFRNNNPYHFEVLDNFCDPTALATLLEISPTPLILEYGEQDKQSLNIQKAFDMLSSDYSGDIYLNRFELGHHVNPGSSTIDLLGVYLK